MIGNQPQCSRSHRPKNDTNVRPLRQHRNHPFDWLDQSAYLGLDPMRIALFAVFAVVLTNAISVVHAEMKAEETPLDGSALFSDLSKEDASKKARAMAETDFARHVYRVWVAGMRRPQSAYDNYLKEKYGVLVTSIAGSLFQTESWGQLTATIRP